MTFSKKNFSSIEQNLLLMGIDYEKSKSGRTLWCPVSILNKNDRDKLMWFRVDSNTGNLTYGYWMTADGYNRYVSDNATTQEIVLAFARFFFEEIAEDE